MIKKINKRKSLSSSVRKINKGKKIKKKVSKKNIYDGVEIEIMNENIKFNPEKIFETKNFEKNDELCKIANTLKRIGNEGEKNNGIAFKNINGQDMFFKFIQIGTKRTDTYVHPSINQFMNAYKLQKLKEFYPYFLNAYSILKCEKDEVVFIAEKGTETVYRYLLRYTEDFVKKYFEDYTEAYKKLFLAMVQQHEKDLKSLSRPTPFDPFDPLYISPDYLYSNYLNVKCQEYIKNKKSTATDYMSSDDFIKDEEEAEKLREVAEYEHRKKKDKERKEEKRKEEKRKEEYQKKINLIIGHINSHNEKYETVVSIFQNEFIPNFKKNYNKILDGFLIIDFLMIIKWKGYIDDKKIDNFMIKTENYKEGKDFIEIKIRDKNYLFNNVCEWEGKKEYIFLYPCDFSSENLSDDSSFDYKTLKEWLISLRSNLGFYTSIENRILRIDCAFIENPTFEIAIMKDIYPRLYNNVNKIFEPFFKFEFELEEKKYKQYIDELIKGTEDIYEIFDSLYKKLVNIDYSSNSEKIYKTFEFEKSKSRSESDSKYFSTLPLSSKSSNSIVDRYKSYSNSILSNLDKMDDIEYSSNKLVNKSLSKKFNKILSKNIKKILPVSKSVGTKLRKFNQSLRKKTPTKRKSSSSSDIRNSSPKNLRRSKRIRINSKKNVSTT